MIARGFLYTREEIVEKLGCGTNTVTAWIAAGLTYGPGMRTDLFSGDDVIDFVTRSGPKNKEGLRESHRKRRPRAR